MTAALVLWSHAIVALLCGVLAASAWRTPERRLPRGLLAAAFGLTALWALAVAGIGQGDPSTALAELLRNLAWLLVMAVLHHRAAPRAARLPVAIGTVYGVVILVNLAALLLHLAQAAVPAAAGDASTVALLRMLSAVAALVLVQALDTALEPDAHSGLRWIELGLAALWGVELFRAVTDYLAGGVPGALDVLRGLVIGAGALAIGAGLQRRDIWSVRVSRTITYQSLSLVALGAYFALLALASSALASLAGTHARLLQTALILGSSAALLALVSNSWLRAWIKVKLAKHLFRHRYDYRAEWMRFTETLGAPEGGAALDARIVKAMADLTDSPAGLLLAHDVGGLTVAAHWNWDLDTVPLQPEPTLAGVLAGHGRILDLDAIRAGRADPADATALPRWMLDHPDAWVLVPLPHRHGLAGAILLARPPVRRPLDWEDLDLLRVAASQAARYLAEARAQAALADAQRFEEFNRRFAFILHDIKNLVSQLTLTARNAERHADNPAFRADMVATLRESADRMSALLARLSQRAAGGPCAAQPVAIAPIVARAVAARSGTHPVEVHAAGEPVAHADPVALEQVVGHLVQNAVEASAPGAAVTVLVAADSRHVTIDVIDRGCGMAPGFVRDGLFKPFVSTKAGGFGIGAFEARQLVLAMGGTLDATSREGQGSRFRIALEAAAADATDAAGPHRPAVEQAA